MDLTEFEELLKSGKLSAIGESTILEVTAATHQAAKKAADDFHSQYPNSVVDKYYCGFRDGLHWILQRLPLLKGGADGKEPNTAPRTVEQNVDGVFQKTSQDEGEAPSPAK